MKGRRWLVPVIRCCRSPLVFGALLRAISRYSSHRSCFVNCCQEGEGPFVKNGLLGRAE
jgi:hypothetical protein